MGKPVAGEVVIAPFPQTDLRPGKPRPALTLVGLPGDDLILCQITSQARHDGFSITLVTGDFVRGTLPVASFIRPNRLFTVDQAVITRIAGQVSPAKLQEALAAARKILSSPYQLGWLCPIYVAESDEQAWKEYEKHLFYFAKQLLKGLVVFPPGYTSVRSIATIHTALSKFLSNVETRKQVEDGCYAIVGSPETVKQKLLENGKKLGVGNLLGLFQLGTLPADLTKKNMQLFAREVMPALQAIEHAPLPAMVPTGAAV